MSQMILITGGARSGKSTYAEDLCKGQNKSTAYIATSVPFDDELKERIKRHRETRPKEWQTYEQYQDIYKIVPEIAKKHQVALLDCVTLMINNLMFDENIDYENCSFKQLDEVEENIKRQVKKLIEEVKKTDLYFVMVTNEIGMSVVAANRLTRVYTDIVGRINQMIAKESDETYLVVSGIPVRVK